MRDEAACDQPPIFFYQPSHHVHVFLSVCIGLRYEQVPEAVLHMHDYRQFTIDF